MFDCRAASLERGGFVLHAIFPLQQGLLAGTTSVEAADAEGWVVSVAPGGGWQPAVVAGHTGVGMSQRMEAFVTDPTESPFNVVG